MDHRQRVVVTGIHLPFWETVNLLVTLAIASIPALIILGVFFGAVGGLVMMAVGSGG